MNSVDTTENDTLIAVKRLAKSKFQYDETSALDPDFGNAAKAAYYSVAAALDEAVLIADTPLTKSELVKLANELIEGTKYSF